MNLVIDIGNTFTKVAVMEGNQLQAFNRIDGPDAAKVNNFLEEYPGIQAGIISSVNLSAEEFIQNINVDISWMVFSNRIRLPFTNRYSTPETLGKDRLAGIAAASTMFPSQDVLVIDAGTAITYDLLTSAGVYLGGAISPGITMRYKALNTFTGRLPLLEVVEEAALIGDSTSASIHSGVLNGAMLEVEGYIQAALRVFPSLTIILTGGDYKYFDKQLKVKTFAAPNLVLEGLNVILNYNLESKQTEV